MQPHEIGNALRKMVEGFNEPVLVAIKVGDAPTIACTNTSFNTGTPEVVQSDMALQTIAAVTDLLYQGRDVV